MGIVTALLGPLYFILPAYIANIAPVLFIRLKFLATPVDFGKKISKKPVFGSHKTWRGLFVATLLGFLVFYLQRTFYAYGIFKSISIVDYGFFPFWFGALMGFGAIFGDLIKSFFKRRLSIAPGKRWVPFDQADFIVGALVFSSFFYVPQPWVWAYLILISIPLHIVARHVGFYLGICKDKW